MKTIREKDFEYYEEKASYFKYTHEPVYEECEDFQDYLTLKPEIIEAVKKKARNDLKQGNERMSVTELEEYILDEGLIKYGETAKVIQYLYVDYEAEFYY